ncbi:site-specific integrase [Viridibacillus sp. YIM B01967]|uniref:Site-specific integrase n=1 Tax=Viridibacillus soli TaxID=2798301 RepID=A0ABS1HCK4_9BACL|nr:site-specific integrase [Viridibacillus soli]MBK3497168.1 site-specific integrase [Viridibacillus soli]
MTNQSKYHPAIQPYQLKNGKDFYRFTAYIGVDPLTGKEVTVTRSRFKTPKQAQVALDKLKYQHNNGQSPENNRKSFADVHKEWDVLYKESGIVMSTYSKTEGYFKNHILPFFSDLKVAKITVRHCEEFAYQLSKELKYFHHIVNYASEVMETAVRYNYINSNPFKTAKIPNEQGQGKIDNYLDIQDFKVLLDYSKNLDSKSYALLRLLMFTGMRKGELIPLTWSDIDFAKKTLAIHDGYSFSKYNYGNNVGVPKGKINRILILDDETLNALKIWQLEQKQLLIQLGIEIKPYDQQLIFSNTVNNFIKQDYPNQLLRKALDVLSLKYITIHGLRHTHATQLTEAGSSLIGIQQRLGHAENKNTTNAYYVHVTEQIKTNTLDLLLAYLAEKGIY